MPIGVRTKIESVERKSCSSWRVRKAFPVDHAAFASPPIGRRADAAGLAIKNGRRGYQERNKKKLKAYYTAYRTKHREAIRRQQAERYRRNPNYVLETNLRIKYGITLADKEHMYRAQKGRCAICRRPLPSLNKAHVDHDHRTLKVRGLVDSVCNVRLAHFERILADPKWSDAAITYLKKAHHER